MEKARNLFRSTEPPLNAPRIAGQMCEQTHQTKEKFYDTRRTRIEIIFGLRSWPCVAAISAEDYVPAESTVYAADNKIRADF